MLSVETVGVALVGYILGSIPFGVLVAKRYGVDIFSVGSGNPGATNVLRSVSKPAGYFVFCYGFHEGIDRHHMVSFSMDFFFRRFDSWIMGIARCRPWAYLSHIYSLSRRKRSCFHNGRIAWGDARLFILRVGDMGHYLFFNPLRCTCFNWFWGKSSSLCDCNCLV